MRSFPLNSARSALLAERALQLRSRPTASESRLWAQLRRNQLGTPFRQQAVLGEFIVDFLAPACRLVVEVDGEYHEQREARDARRDRKLQRLGYRVLRLPAQLVMAELSGALERIEQALRTSG